jgi:hypothetical protein
VGTEISMADCSRFYDPLKLPELIGRACGMGGIDCSLWKFPCGVIGTGESLSKFPCCTGSLYDIPPVVLFELSFASKLSLIL